MIVSVYSSAKRPARESRRRINKTSRQDVPLYKGMCGSGFVKLCNGTEVIFLRNGQKIVLFIISVWIHQYIFLNLKTHCTMSLKVNLPYHSGPFPEIGGQKCKKVCTKTKVGM